MARRSAAPGRIPGLLAVVAAVALLTGCGRGAPQDVTPFLSADVMSAITNHAVQSCKADHRQNVWRCEFIVNLPEGGTRGLIASFPSSARDSFEKLMRDNKIVCPMTIKE